MPSLDAARDVALEVMKAADSAALSGLLAEICARMGCCYFALTHHVDFLEAPNRGVRLHNYPEDWAAWFDQHRLGLSDPIHRASQRTTAGFLWRDIARFVPPRRDDERILAHARLHGIGDGLTVPAHVPGDAHGSVSFAWGERGEANDEALPFAQMVGNFAFEAARRIAAPLAAAPRPQLTDRQLECIIWAARGKSDWVIAQILGLRRDTVVEHMRNARDRYDAPSRTVLTVRALFDGSITFGDIANR